MQDLEDRLRELSDRVSQELPLELSPTPRARRRIRVNRAARGGAGLAIVAALAIGGFFAADIGWPDAAPQPPADRKDQDTPPPSTARNGIILNSGEANVWQEETAPPWPGESAYAWNAFDQDSGSFIFVSPSGRIFMVRQDGPVAKFACPPATLCESIDFGPGREEVSVPDEGLQSVQVIGFEGTVRERVDMSAAFVHDEELASFAWSPDGSRLAISTQPEYGCDPSDDPCDGKIWIFDPDGGDPQLVFKERTPDKLVKGKYPNNPVLGELAWSPDGGTLSLVVASQFIGTGADTEPRLVALRLPPDQPVIAETLHEYDHRDWRTEGMEALLEAQFDIHFAFAWSPDGTRIAVTDKGGVAEISSEDGDVLVRRPGLGLHGPLAWLPKP